MAFYLGVLELTDGSSDGTVLSPWWNLALVLVAVPAAVAAITAVPARLSAQISVTEALRYE